MAEMSADTKAIIDTLMEQGRLLRNDGRTNSIKTVNIKLDKFQDSFNSMNRLLGDISASLRVMVGGDGQQGTIQVGSPAAAGGGTAAQIQQVFEEGQERDELMGQIRDQLKRQADLDDAELERAERVEKEKQEQEKRDRIKKQGEDNMKALKENTLSGQLLSNPVSFLTKVLKGALIGFVGFNVIRGVVDAWTGGAMTEFIEGIDWEAIGSNFKDLAEWLGSNKWAAFTGVLSSWLLVDFGVPLAVNAVGEALRTNALTTALARMSGQQITSAPGFLTTSNLLKAGVLGLVATGLAFAGEKIRDSIRFDDMSEEQILKAEAVGYDTPSSAAASMAGYTAAGATIGSFFGPKGAIVGAALGFAYGVSKKIYEVMNRTDLEDIEVANLDAEVQLTRVEQAKKMLQDHIDGKKVLFPQEIAAYEKISGFEINEEGTGFTSDVSSVIQDIELGNAEAIAKNKLEAKQELDRLRDLVERRAFLNLTETANMSQQFNRETGQYEDYIITDPEAVRRMEDEYAEKLAEQEEVYRQIRELEAQRILSGQLEAGDFIYVTPDGFLGGAGDFLGFTSNQARLEEMSELEKFNAFLEGAELNVSKEVMKSALDAIESGAISAGNAIVVLKAGDTQQTNVDASDKSTSSNYTFTDTAARALLPTE
jgi:hypothetical protein